MYDEVQRLVARFFASRDEDPGAGKIEVQGERYVLVRGAALSIEFFRLVRGLFGEGRQVEADQFSRNFLYDLAHALGRADARRFHDRMALQAPLHRLMAGPVQFAFTGWATVRLLPESVLVPGPDWLVVYEHDGSFEAEAWLAAGERQGAPICIMNAGYSSGWSSESVGQPLAACELSCRARGDDACHFVMAPPEQLEARVGERLAPGAALLDPVHGLPIPDFFSRKRMEEELRQAHDALEARVRERTRELEESVRHLQQERDERARLERRLAQTLKLDAIGKLAGGIAHDFGNLMTVIANRGELLEGQVDGPTGNGHLAAIRIAAERAVALTDQLRRLSRGQQPADGLVDVGPVLVDLAGLADRGLGGRVRVQLQLVDQALPVWIDKSQLEQVILNLLVNARDAMPAGGTIQLRARAVGREDLPPAFSTGLSCPRWIRVEVEDSGIGMSAELVDQIFDPAFTTKAEGRGTGLGLATVSSIVERGGGAIRVHSVLGQGSCFSLWLPWGEGPPEPLADRALP